MSKELGIQFNSIQIPPEGMERSPWAYASNPGYLNADRIKNLSVDTITVSDVGFIRSGKEDFDDDSAGWFLSQKGVYIGSDDDATKFKFDVESGVMDFVGSHSGGTVGGVAITDIFNIGTPTADAIPTGLSVTDSGITVASTGQVSAYISLTWNAITTDTFNEYQLRFKKDSFVFYTYINIKDNEITIDNLDPNTKYNFSIASINKHGTRSNFSANIDHTTPLSTVPPATVSNVSVTGSIQYVILEWDANVEKDLASYNIYRNTVNNPSTATIIANVKSNNFIDGGLTGGTEYFYWLKAVNTSDLVSNDFSDVQSATPRNVASADNQPGNTGWTQTCVFSSTSANQVNWSAGGLTVSNGTTYNILAGNTGTMAARTYIYLDLNVSETEYQTTTTATDAVGDGKVLVATAINNTATGAVDCSFQVFGGVGGMTIDGGDIISESITTNQIAANTIKAGNIFGGTITATEINTSTITSLENLSLTANQVLIDGEVTLSNWRNSTDLTKIDGGNLYVGSQITIGSGTADGHIKSGQSAYNTGVGWWIGLDSGNPKLSIGNPEDSYFTYDSSTGNITIKANITMEGGSISWADVTAPDYDNIGGTKPPSNATAGATWGSNITNQPSDSSITNPSYITSNKITATTIESPTITAGTITGATINAKSGTTTIASLDSSGLKIYGQFATWYPEGSTTSVGQIVANSTTNLQISTFNNRTLELNGANGASLNAGANNCEIRTGNTAQIRCVHSGNTTDYGGFVGTSNRIFNAMYSTTYYFRSSSSNLKYLTINSSSGIDCNADFFTSGQLSSGSTSIKLGAYTFNIYEDPNASGKYYLRTA